MCFSSFILWLSLTFVYILFIWKTHTQKLNISYNIFYGSSSVNAGVHWDVLWMTVHRQLNVEFGWKCFLLNCSQCQWSPYPRLRLHTNACMRVCLSYNMSVWVFQLHYVCLIFSDFPIAAAAYSLCILLLLFLFLSSSCNKTASSSSSYLENLAYIHFCLWICAEAEEFDGCVNMWITYDAHVCVLCDNMDVRPTNLSTIQQK